MSAVHAITDYERKQVERVLYEFRHGRNTERRFLMDLAEAAYHGGKVYAEPRIQHQRLAPGDYVGDEFRASFDAWLGKFFGYRPTLIPRGKAIRLASGCIIGPDDFDRLAEAVR